MNSLVSYDSEEDNESEQFGAQQFSGAGGGSRRREDDDNYDDVNMDMSEDSQGGESEPELPQVESTKPARDHNETRRSSDDSRERDRDRDRDDRRDRRRESPNHRSRSDRGRDDRRNSKNPRWGGDRGRGSDRRGLLGDRPDDRSSDKVPALMDLKPFASEAPPAHKAHDARDAVLPRFVDRERRDREREREGRERDRHSRRSEERRSHKRSERSRSRGSAYPPPSSSSSERRGSPSSGDYRPSSYKVNKKLEVMEKMGLQIKTPDGSMTTAQQLRAAAHDTPQNSKSGANYYNPAALSSAKVMEQIQKRKLLWANKNKSEAEEAAKWSGTKFAQDNDGKQVSKFMRLMGIKQPSLQNEPADATADPNKKQEELFQAMQAQYEVARATTHTMRGVGLGFQRTQY